jgi:hypothetical protein|tara:strand:- start:11124 stop:12395 length:1272 start_codon:yes stop_codon:yes gene_type:complete
MPCKKCKDGKVKWGNTGECKYDTIEECKEANADYYEEEEKEPTRIVELVIEDDSEALAIDAISLVSNPAIEQNFVYMNKRKNNLTLAKIEDEKREIISPALIPDKSIFRFDPNTGSEYYVWFSKSTVKQAAYLYLEHNNHHKATYEHKDRVAGVLTVESWIVEDPKIDKSRLYGYKNLPKGTWMVKMSIQNEKLWEEVKLGTVRGLSIEGYFIDRMQKMNKMEKSKIPTDADILSALNELFKEGKLNKLSKVKRDTIAKRLELKDMKTVDKLTAQLETFNNKLETLFDKVDDAVKVAEESEEERTQLSGMLDFAEDAVAITKNKLKEVQKTLNNDNKALSKAEGKFEKATAKMNKLDEKVAKVNQNYKDTWNKADDIADDLKDAISAVEKAAKALGIGSPPVADGKSAIKDFKSKLDTAAQGY